MSEISEKEAERRRKISESWKRRGGLSDEHKKKMQQGRKDKKIKQSKEWISKRVDSRRKPVVIIKDKVIKYYPSQRAACRALGRSPGYITRRIHSYGTLVGRMVIISFDKEKESKIKNIEKIKKNLETT